MIVLSRTANPERPSDASVVSSAADIAGARHEVLPPRRIRRNGQESLTVSRAAPP